MITVKTVKAVLRRAGVQFEELQVWKNRRADCIIVNHRNWEMVTDLLRVNGFKVTFAGPDLIAIDGKEC